MNYQELVGRPFDIEKQNCYHLLRDFYRLNYDIELTDYPCPANWWDNGLDLYNLLAEDEGFQPVSLNPRNWLPGDVLVMAIQSSVGNHCGIVLDTGQIFHHLYGQLSCVTAFGGMFRNGLVAVYRHKDVSKVSDAVPTTDLMEVLPTHVRRRLEHARAEAEAAGLPPAD
jgi:cell wall-associated NlpC family hydrolase